MEIYEGIITVWADYILREAVPLSGELVRYSATWVGCMVTLNRAAWLVV